MRANPNEDLDSQYQNLTEKQQAVIDAYAKHPDETNREIARIAGEEILGEDDPVNESYASEITKDKYADLAEYRAEIEQNGRPEGQEQTIGDPFAELQQQQSHDVQGIADRPVKQSQGRDDDSDQGQGPQWRTFKRRNLCRLSRLWIPETVLPSNYPTATHSKFSNRRNRSYPMKFTNN